MQKECLACKKLFLKPKTCGRPEWSTRKYCSVPCKNSHLHKGSLPWNKGLTSADPRVRKYAHNSGNFLPQNVTGDKNHNWKGSEASYSAKHMWVKYHFGKPQVCQQCNTTMERMYHWANISKKYLRQRDDWLRLCVPCHKKYDLAR